MTVTSMLAINWTRWLNKGPDEEEEEEKDDDGDDDDDDIQW